MVVVLFLVVVLLGWRPACVGEAGSLYLSVSAVTVPGMCTPVDIVLIIDTGSVCQASPPCYDFTLLKVFADTIAGALIFANPRTRVAGIQLGAQGGTEIAWEFSSDSKSVTSKIDSLTSKPTSATAMDTALDMVVDELFFHGKGDQPGVINAALVITDGLPLRLQETAAAAKRLHTVGFLVLAVGVQMSLYKHELEPYLKEITSNPKVQSQPAVSEGNRVKA